MGIPTIHNNVKIIGGEDTFFGDRIEISAWKDQASILTIGKGVKIASDVRICAGGNVTISDNVSLYNHVTIIGPGDCFIDTGSWIAQGTALDCYGELSIGKDCCIGFNCQIWSHVKRAPFIENMKFYSIKKTVLEDRVWLMGGLITVSPGVTISHDCVIFSNSVVSHNTESAKVYAGIPAKILEQYKTPFKESNG